MSGVIRKSCAAGLDPVYSVENVTAPEEAKVGLTNEIDIRAVTYPFSPLGPPP